MKMAHNRRVTREDILRALDLDEGDRGTDQEEDYNEETDDEPIENVFPVPSTSVLNDSAANTRGSFVRGGTRGGRVRTRTRNVTKIMLKLTITPLFKAAATNPFS